MRRTNRREFLGTAAAGALGTGALALGAGSLAGVAGCRSARGPEGPGAGLGSPLDAFEVTEEQAGRVLARALQSGGDHADLFFQRARTNVLRVEDGAVNRAFSREDLGLGVRVIRGVETGYAYTESLDLPSMLKAAEVAAAIAGGAAGSAKPVQRVGRGPSYYPVKQPWPGVPTGDKVQLLLRLQGLTAAGDTRVKKINITHQDDDGYVVLLNSAGQLVADQQPMATLRLSCTAEHQGRRESNFSMLSGRAGLELLTDERLRALAREAVDRTIVLFDAVPGPVGELPVVLAPGSSGILLHEAIGHGMEADHARMKTTIFADKAGQRIAPEHVTIVDDGTIPSWRGSINVDDEGTPGQRTVLVDRGVLRTFLHDRISARHFGVSATGNGRRESFRHMPIPRMRNTYMLAGPHGREEILRSVRRGIYAENFTNGQVDTGAGDFTFYIKNGFLIEDGRLTRPIKDVNLIGNGPRVLERVTMVGTDEKLDQGAWTCGKRGQGVPVGLGLPTVKVSAITVGGTQG